MYKCRNCNCELKSFFWLWDMPSINLFLDKDQIKDEKKYDLTVAFCENCKLVQITETIPPEDMFVEYTYLSSMSNTMLNHAKIVAQKLTERLWLDNDSLVLEVASNDWYLLQYFKELWINILWVDPAKNIAKIANEKWIETIDDFFNLELAENIFKTRQKKADLVYWANVLAHVPTITDFLKWVDFMLTDKWTAVFEFPYLSWLFEWKFDTIYHEHVFYYSALAINNMCKNVWLDFYDVEINDMQWWSLFVYLSKPWVFKISENVTNLLANELKLWYDKFETYLQIKQKAEKIKVDLIKLLEKIKKEWKKIVWYWAAAKWNVMLNYFWIWCEYLDYIMDKAPTKQWLYSPWKHIKIESPDILNTDNPDYILILPWNISWEIIKQLDFYKNRWWKFIIAIPELSII